MTKKNKDTKPAAPTFWRITNTHNLNEFRSDLRVAVQAASSTRNNDIAVVREFNTWSDAIVHHGYSPMAAANLLNETPYRSGNPVGSGYWHIRLSQGLRIYFDSDQNSATVTVTGVLHN